MKSQNPLGITNLVGLHYSRIGQLFRRGMPVLADGSIPQDRAVAWYRENVRRSVLKSGPGRPGRLKKDLDHTDDATRVAVVVGV